MTTTGKRRREWVEDGSGNVFADLGFAEPEEALAKAQLASHIRQIIKRRRLTRAAAGRILGIGQPQMSALMDGQSGAFPAARPMEFPTARGQDVEIMVRPTRKRHGEMSVVVR